MKICVKCNEELPIEHFYNNKLLKDGHENICKECKRKSYQVRYVNDDKYKVYKQTITKKYKQENQPKVQQLNHDWYIANKDRHRDNKKRYNSNHKKDIKYRLKLRLRERLKRYIKRCNLYNISSTKHIDCLGCSIDKLKSYLESKFLPGMTWSNYGFYGWHIDHVVPLSSFDITDSEQLKKACHYSNLQPLWAEDNLRKSFL